MTEVDPIFAYDSDLRSFNDFAKFPKEKQSVVLEQLQKASETVINPGDGTRWEIIESYVKNSYEFAKAIDPNYRMFNEKSSGYVSNPETERLLILYYEMISGKTREEITEAVTKIKEASPVL